MAAIASVILSLNIRRVRGRGVKLDFAIASWLIPIIGEFLGVYLQQIAGL
jgi:hypothetical protein